MDKTFYTRGNFDECAKVDQSFDSPFKYIPFGTVFDEAVEWTFLCLFEGKADSLLFRIDIKDFHIHFVADIHSILDFFDPAVAQFGNMGKTIHFPEIDECSESRDAHDF